MNCQLCGAPEEIPELSGNERLALQRSRADKYRRRHPTKEMGSPVPPTPPPTPPAWLETRFASRVEKRWHEHTTPSGAWKYAWPARADVSTLVLERKGSKWVHVPRPDRRPGQTSGPSGKPVSERVKVRCQPGWSDAALAARIPLSQWVSAAADAALAREGGALRHCVHDPSEPRRVSLIVRKGWHSAAWECGLSISRWVESAADSEFKRRQSAQ